jgi:hypothetical protein
MADDLEQRLDSIYFQLVQHGRAWGAKAAPWQAEIEVNCERVKLELAGAVIGLMDYAWLGAFAQLEYSPLTGKTTVFAGPKAGAKHPRLAVRRLGEGRRVHHPLAIKGGDSMDFSFVPVFGGSG